MIAAVFGGFNRARIHASMTGYVAMGSNLGDRGAHLRAGLEGLVDAGVRLIEVSSVWETEPDGMPDAPHFWNMVVEIETDRTPHELLDLLLAIERQQGRHRNGPDRSRTLDLDLLLMGDLSVDDALLRLPHPRLWERSFVLAPLAEIAPGLRNALNGRSVEDELAGIAHPTGVCNIGMLDRAPTVLL